MSFVVPVAHERRIFEPFHIGNVPVCPGLILAPMSGVTDLPFRTLLRELNPGAIGLTVTEFISVEALTRENAKSLKMMIAHRDERPFSVQIFGHDIDRMTRAAQMVEESGADIVDINSGCPVPKVVKRGGGCELMRQPLHLAKMLEAVVRAVNIPVTLKVRSGWDEKSRNAVEIAKLAEQSGIRMLAVHGRTRQDAYRGEADWDYIRQVADAVSIPVAGSGDVVCARTLAERLRVAPVRGVLIGRGALANPWIFSEIAADVRGELRSDVFPQRVPRVIRRYEQLVREHLPEQAILGRLKQLASQVTKLVRGSSGVRRELCTSKAVAEFLDILMRWEECLEMGQFDSADDGSYEHVSDAPDIMECGA